VKQQVFPLGFVGVRAALRDRAGIWRVMETLL